MAIFKENFSLKKHNTFNIDVECKYYFEYDTTKEILEFLKENNIIDTEFLIIGSGSNLLFTDNYNGLVIRSNIKGIEVLEQDSNHVYVKVGAGVVWDELVDWSVDNNYSGIENLSSIPGTVGASPVQNIGAYGVEVADVIEQVYAISIEDNREFTFNNADCEFKYRDSIFKNEFKNMFIVNHVIFKLNKNHKFNIAYGNIDSALKNKDINLINVRNTIAEIRDSKLPDPKILGNAGSFFKNPIVEKEIADTLKLKYPDIPVYKIDDAKSKIAAGWLIESTGWKGKSLGQAAIHKNQALVIINKGDAKGIEIIKLANEVSKAVFLKFGIKLEMEVKAI